jgi:hypothetical protein
MASAWAATALLRTAVIVGLVVVLGPPITDNIRFLAFVVAGFVILALPLRRSAWPYLAALGLAALVVIATSALPRASIEEGHNVFLYPGTPTVLERELPPPVFEALRDEFLAQYPSRQCRGKHGCWLNQKMPTRAFAFSADSVWRPAAYSRVVDDIDFSGLASFRGTFVNDRGYNWYTYAHDLQRDNMPFFVMYVLPEAVVGGRLCWRGHVLWEREDGGFEPLPHTVFGCRAITSTDAGRRVFGASILTDEPLAMNLVLPVGYRAANLVGMALRLLGVLGIVLLCAQVPVGRSDITPDLRRRIVLFALTMACVFIYSLTRGHDFAFGGFPPLDGGNDGLTYEGLGRSVVMGIAAGDLTEILRGGRDVFVNMPGLPYFRALEKTVFGSTNHLYAALLITTPFVIWSLARVVLSPRWAWWFAIAFLFFPLLGEVGLWYYNYLLRGMDSGFAEPLAMTLMFAALALTLRSLDSGRGEFVAPAFAANLMFAFAVLCRPNFGPAAAVVILVAIWRLRRSGRLWEGVAAAAGFLPVLFMLWHNYHFGGVLVPATSSATSEVTLSAPPSVYLAAAGELFGLDPGQEALAVVGRHWRLWLRGGLLLPLLLILLVQLFRGRLSPEERLIAYAALSQHVELLFWNSQSRFNYIAWALTVFALLGSLERAARMLWAQRNASRRLDHGDHRRMEGT